MTAEQIVRALAAADPICEDAWYGCGLCGSVGVQADPHEPDCPWRLAVEWVAAQDDREAAERLRVRERSDLHPLRWCRDVRGMRRQRNGAAMTEYVSTGSLHRGVVKVEDWAPRPAPVQWLVGRTAAGRTVEIIGDPYVDERATVTIDGRAAVVLRGSRLRDGGTTDLTTDLGRVYRPQRRFVREGEEPRPATLDGEEISEGQARG